MTDYFVLNYNTNICFKPFYTLLIINSVSNGMYCELRILWNWIMTFTPTFNRKNYR